MNISQQWQIVSFTGNELKFHVVVAESCITSRSGFLKTEKCPNKFLMRLFSKKLINLRKRSDTRNHGNHAADVEHHACEHVHHFLCVCAHALVCKEKNPGLH